MTQCSYDLSDSRKLLIRVWKSRSDLQSEEGELLVQ